jgi:hypothetical protein
VKYFTGENFPIYGMMDISSMQLETSNLLETWTANTAWLQKELMANMGAWHTPKCNYGINEAILEIML